MLLPFFGSRDSLLEHDGSDVSVNKHCYEQRIQLHYVLCIRLDSLPCPQSQTSLHSVILSFMCMCILSVLGIIPLHSLPERELARVTRCCVFCTSIKPMQYTMKHRYLQVKLEQAVTLLPTLGCLRCLPFNPWMMHITQFTVVLLTFAM